MADLLDGSGSRIAEAPYPLRPTSLTRRSTFTEWAALCDPNGGFGTGHTITTHVLGGSVGVGWPDLRPTTPGYRPGQQPQILQRRHIGPLRGGVRRRLRNDDRERHGRRPGLVPKESGRRSTRPAPA
jgi:hypothetical protein